jgi:hypothetical protein
MSKVRKGHEAQDRVISQFRKDARSSDSGAAWRACLAKPGKAVAPKEEVRMSFRFLATGK